MDKHVGTIKVFSRNDNMVAFVRLDDDVEETEIPIPEHMQAQLPMMMAMIKQQMS
jgi:hypothetical protein